MEQKWFVQIQLQYSGMARYSGYLTTLASGFVFYAEVIFLFALLEDAKVIYFALELWGLEYYWYFYSLPNVDV